MNVQGRSRNKIGNKKKGVTTPFFVTFCLFSARFRCILFLAFFSVLCPPYAIIPQSAYSRHPALRQSLSSLHSLCFSPPVSCLHPHFHYTSHYLLPIHTLRPLRSSRFPHLPTNFPRHVPPALSCPSAPGASRVRCYIAFPKTPSSLASNCVPSAYVFLSTYTLISSGVYGGISP